MATGALRKGVEPRELFDMVMGQAQETEKDSGLSALCAEKASENRDDILSEENPEFAPGCWFGLTSEEVKATEKAAFEGELAERMQELGQQLHATV
ncbi:hypothetical protein PPTG_16705 [Phytophthora nicotianae INRA-310]|uniref:Uncharacterized protein n=2 Tax=Phytophthora nicotianae TaxID=4792 RepID=W2PPT5_PHYN3|nr:hypothetical protein PPTG_16705 [Phytophthora nicotianae INRA-310]ETN02035.1 hypothetical protein PPTG_16705 [Phytophthora nicotianae INRA-310]ETO64328.1 hypothetical protein F444_18120 [Phytophthora nicotianae P1976]